MTKAKKTAVLHRMVMPDHVCPYGQKSLWLLRRKGYAVQDHHLKTREETDAFKAEHGVKTTPQTFINGRRIGGYDDLRKHFGLGLREEGETSYVPVVAVFVVAALLAVASLWPEMAVIPLAERFIAFGMCLLAMLKLQDVEKFSSMFLNYDLLGRRFVPYAYFYPFAELAAGVLMLAGALHVVSVPLGFVSLTENLMMLAMGLWMGWRYLLPGI